MKAAWVPSDQLSSENLTASHYVQPAITYKDIRFQGLVFVCGPGNSGKSQFLSELADNAGSLTVHRPAIYQLRLDDLATQLGDSCRFVLLIDDAVDRIRLSSEPSQPWERDFKVCQELAMLQRKTNGLVVATIPTVRGRSESERVPSQIAGLADMVITLRRAIQATVVKDHFDVNEKGAQFVFARKGF